MFLYCGPWVLTSAIVYVVIGEPEGALVADDELAEDVLFAAPPPVVELLLLPQAESANAPVKHATTTTRNDLGRRMRAQMLSCGGMLPNLPGGSQRG
jgi:hypothetical protein